jgi:ABC-type nitrate/sulfonate/bicarbonate transport system substrate-binding protein
LTVKSSPWIARTRRAALAVAVAALAAAATVGPAPAQTHKLTYITTVNLPISLPLLVGLRNAAQDGIAIEVKEVRESEAAVLAVAQGQGQIGAGYYSLFPAVEKGAPVVALMEFAQPAFVLLARKEITDVRELNNVQLATHSAKASQKVLLDFFLARDYPGVKPTYVYMPAGSPARAEALLSGAVKAASMDITAASTVLRRAPGQFHSLIDMTRVPVSNFFLVARREYVAQQPEVLATVVRRVLESYRKGADDPTYWVRERGEYFKSVPAAQLEGEMRDLVRVYDLNGGVERLRGKGALDNLQFQITSENLPGPLTRWKPEQFFAPQILEGVLKQIGTR